MQILIGLFQTRAKAVDSLRMAENILIAENDTHLCIGMAGHEMHQPCSSLSGLIIVTAHISNPFGMLDIGVKSDNRDTLFVQPVDFFPHFIVIVGSKGNSVHTILNQLVNGGELRLQRKGNLHDRNGAAITRKFTLFGLDAFQHLMKERVAGEENHAN